MEACLAYSHAHKRDRKRKPVTNSSIPSTDINLVAMVETATFEMRALASVITLPVLRSAIAAVAGS